MSQMKKIMAAVAGLSLATAANAATITVTPVVTHAFTPVTFVEVPVPPDNALPLVYQIDFLLTVDGINAGANEVGLGNLAFDVNFSSPALNTSSAPGYNPVNPTVDINGGAPGGLNPLFTQNGDLGAPGDLKFITLGVASAVFTAQDPRGTVGQDVATDGLDRPFNFGNIFVDYTGAGQQTLSLASQGLSLHYTNGQNQEVTGQPGQTLSLGSVQFGAVGTIPEPTSLALLSLGALGIARRRRA
jgi:hypothetical protein